MLEAEISFKDSLQPLPALQHGSAKGRIVHRGLSGIQMICSTAQKVVDNHPGPGSLGLPEPARPLQIHIMILIDLLGMRIVIRQGGLEGTVEGHGRIGGKGDEECGGHTFPVAGTIGARAVS